MLNHKLNKMEFHLLAIIWTICVNVVIFADAGKVVCYYGSWAGYRYGNGKCEVENIDPFVCTHIIYTFVGLDAATNKIKHLDSYIDLDRGAISRFNGLRKTNPNLKTIVAIGGWNEGSVKYSNMAASKATRQIFIKSVVEFMVKYTFDGFDVDWEYPVLNGGAAADKQNYPLLLKELKEAFTPYGFLLSAAVGVGSLTVQNAYDVPAMSQYLDFINLMAYDYHGGWDRTTGHNAPLYARSDETGDQALLNVKSSVDLWIRLGAPPEKLILGVGLYGVTFTLSNANVNGYNAPTSGPGLPGPYTQQSGTLGYHEILERFANGGWTVVRDQYGIPYAYKDNQWIGYDDELSVRKRMQFAKSMGLGGGMVWSIETEDFLGVHGKAYPLISVIKEEYGTNSDPVTTQTPATTNPTTASTTTKATTVSTTTKPTTASTTTNPTTVSTTTKTTTASTTTKPTTASTTTQQTTTTSSSGSDVTSYILSKCPTESYIRHPTDCSKFFTCTYANGKYTIHEFQCQNGLMFDTYAKVCNWANQVKC